MQELPPVYYLMLVFRRLRDDLFDGKILAVGMIRLGGFELQKSLRGSVL